MQYRTSKLEFQLLRLQD